MQPTATLAKLAQRLGTVVHFKRFAQADLETIVRAGQMRFFAAGSTIYCEGDPCAGMFVLLSGEVHLHKVGPQGQESLIAIIHPVIMFNEVTVLDGGTNLATARAIQDCSTWNVLHENFQTLMHQYPQVGIGLLKVLASRTRLLLSQYEDISFRSVLARTAKLLLDLSDYGRNPIDRKQYPSKAMAARIATVPEALSRSLQVFKKNGDISTTRAAIIVHAPETLARLAQVDPTLFKG